jgi:small basic protein (TIGR04137 family)
MSIHSSLRGVNTLVGQRSVYTRIERLQILKKAGKFDPEKDSVRGLVKVRTKFKVAGAKKKAPKPEAEAAAAPVVEAEAPKEAAKPAAKGKGKKE